MGSHLPAQAVLILAAISVSYVVAFLSWHCYEKHFLSLKRFFEYGRPGAAPVPATTQPAFADSAPAAAGARLIGRSSREANPVAGD